ncbi:head-tail adaptor protein [Xanthobacter autotrophicus]|uniref:head-tail adaptor protein n=1 Tax=Xanthobacter autotrophicus TaxID=280 RepID=UPI00372AC109
MSVGALRHRLTHQTAVDLPDGAGGIARTFLTVGVLWGAIEPLATDYGLAEERPRASRLLRLTVRAPNTVAAGDRLLHAGRSFHVEAVVDADGRGRFHHIRCREEET